MDNARLPTLRDLPRRWTAADGGRVFTALERSSLTDAEFARRIGIQPQRLRRWRRPASAVRLVEVEHAELALMLEGLELAGARRRVRRRPAAGSTNVWQTSDRSPMASPWSACDLAGVAHEGLRLAGRDRAVAAIAEEDVDDHRLGREQLAICVEQVHDPGVQRARRVDREADLAAAGDLDGDGLGDLVLGNAETGDMSGAALVYFAPWSGTVDTDPAQADAAIVGTVAGGRVGYSVEVADVDGDGQADLLVGALSWDGDLGQAGAVGVFYGPIEPGRRGLGDADALFVGTVDAAWFGDGEPRVGDVNGDGVPDLVLSAPMEDAQSTNSDNGVVRVFYGAGF